MEAHYSLSDAQFIAQLESCSLDPTLFTHEAHLRLAWINIKSHGIEKAVELTQHQIVSYVQHLGANDKYNATLTVAATRAVYHFMLKVNTWSFEEFIAKAPQLKTEFKKLIESHYGFDIFNSQEAKAKYLEPDLCEFD